MLVEYIPTNLLGKKFLSYGKLLWIIIDVQKMHYQKVVLCWHFTGSFNILELRGGGSKPQLL